MFSLNVQILSQECLWNLWNLQLSPNIHEEIHIEPPATSFYFHLALMLESIPLKRFFSFICSLDRVSLSLYIPSLPLSLSHPIESLRFTFKAICSLSLPQPLSQPPDLMPAPLSHLLIWGANDFQLFHHWGEDSPALPHSHGWVPFQIPLLKRISKTLFCSELLCESAAAETEFCHVMLF